MGSFSITERTTLSYLSRESALYPSELAEINKIKKQSMSQVLNRLEGAKMIRRVISKEDKRKVAISLTALGKKMVEQSRYERDEWLAGAMQSVLQEKEMRILEAAIPLLEKDCKCVITMITAIDKNTALVVIDLQDGIVKMNMVHPATDIVRHSARLVAAFHEAGLPVVIVNVVPFGAPSGKVRTQAPSGLPKDEAAQKQAREAMEAAGFFTIVPELGAAPDDIYITKKTWNAFYDTSLDQELKKLGVTNIVLCGIATSIGVEGTARAAHEKGYNLTFAEDAMTDRLASAHDNSCTAIFPRIGEVGTTEAIIEQLGNH